MVMLRRSSEVFVEGLEAEECYLLYTLHCYTMHMTRDCIEGSGGYRKNVGERFGIALKALSMRDDQAIPISLY